MQQPKHIETNNGSLLELHKMALLDDRQWRQIQKRYFISPRELQIAKLICHGFNNDEIAEDLDIKRGTVKTHIRNIYRRIRVKNKLELLLTFLHDAAAGLSAESDSKPLILKVLESANRDKKTANKRIKMPPKT